MDELRIIINLNTTLYLTNPQTKNHEFIQNFIENPKPGYLVYEASTQRTESFGRFLLKQEETVKTEEHSYKDTFWYVEDLNHNLQRWSNCKFEAVFQWSIFEFREIENSLNKANREWAESRIRYHDICTNVR